MDRFQELFDYVSQNTGLNVTNWLPFLPLYYNLEGQRDWGFKLPQWAELVFPDLLGEALVAFYRSRTATEEMKMFSAGYMVKKIIEEMREKVEGNAPNDRKIYLYSGHELNIAFLQIFLDVFNEKPPEFGAYNVFELHKFADKWGVKVSVLFYLKLNEKLI